MIADENLAALPVEHRAKLIYKLYCFKGAVSLEPAYQHGMIRKAELQDGITYAGYCRNATTATWRAKDSCFEIVRHKFGRKFLEQVVAPEDDSGFDIFVAVNQI